MKKTKKRMTAYLITALCLAMSLFSMPVVYAGDALRSSPEIKVGMIELKGYATENADGTFTGANVEFAYKIAQYANLNIKIVMFQSGTEALAAIDNGTIDVMCNVLKTTDREEKYLFSEREVGSLPMSIFCRNDDDRFTYDNISQLNHIKIGAESGTKVKMYFSEWCVSHDVTPQIVEYNSLQEIKTALENKEIDAGIYGSPSVEGYRSLGTFSPQPYYFIFRKTSSDLKKKVDDAMSSILSEDPLYRNKLVHKYVSQISPDMENLTVEEDKYIQTSPDVTVAVLENDQPYYSEDEQGKDTGVVPDFYQKISDLTGLQFTYEVYESEEDAVTAVLNGEADVLGMYSNGQIDAYNNGLRITSPYASVDAVLVTHSGVSVKNVKKIGVKKRTMNSIQSVVGPSVNADLIGYNNGQECFTALKAGKVDAIVLGQPTANWLINQSNVSTYSMTTVSSNSIEIVGALAYDDATLCTILSKAINATSYSFNEIATKDTLPKNDLKAAITRLSPLVLLISLAAVSALVVFMVWALTVVIRHQKEKNLLLQQKAENDRRQIELATAAKQTEEKNQFFSNISHDMRTPLNAIIGFSDLAAEDAIAPRTKEYLEKIKTSGQLLNDLINDTLTISKVNSGKMVLQLKATDTDEIFDAIYYPVLDMAQKKGVTFTMDRTECEGRDIMVDPLSLEKVLLNLLTNAVKYTNKGGWVKLIARIEPSDEGKPQTVFIVQDNGIGISDEFLPRIYEPFLQEENHGCEATGTGLGLAIVKNLVDMMGGTIEVESTKNVGTKFTVHFHFDTLERPVAAKKEEKDISNLTGKHVLLCEDNSLNREIASELLRRKGMIVDTAVNGLEGVEKFQQSKDHTYDVILMDVRMPVMNGLDAAKAIRSSAHPDAKVIPIIALTANAFEDDIKECIAAGMNGHVAKPIEPEVMFHTISQNIL